MRLEDRKVDEKQEIYYNLIFQLENYNSLLISDCKQEVFSFRIRKWYIIHIYNKRQLYRVDETQNQLVFSATCLGFFPIMKNFH